MADSLAGDIIRHFENVASKRTTFDTSWQEIADHTLGRRDFLTKRTPGEVRTVQIYDTTAMLASGLLTSGLDSLLTNSADRWFKLKPRDSRLMEMPGVAEWFQVVEDVMYDSFNRPEARFTPQLHECYFDLVNFGTCCLWVEDDGPNGLLFSSRPLGEIFVAEDAKGRISNVFRRFRYTAVQAVEMWGDEKVPHAVKQVDKGDGFAETEYLHWVRRNDSPAPGSLQANGRNWLSDYVSIESKTHLSRGGFDENPYMVSRWSVDPGEVYGRGPGLMALPTAKMLNAMEYTLIKAAQKAVDPPLLVEHDSIITQMQTDPGSTVIYNPTGLNRVPVQAFGNEGRVDIGEGMIDRHRQHVKSSYHAELLQVLQDPRMTATQVLEISNTMRQLFSPILGRQYVELIEPMTLRAFNILVRQRRIPPAPPAIQGQEFKIEFMSPVARAQKQGLADSIVKTYTIATNLSAAMPEVLDNLDADEAMRIIAEANGAPMSIIRPREEVANIRSEREEVADQQQQQQEMVQAAESGSKLLPALAGLQGGGAPAEAV